MRKEKKEELTNIWCDFGYKLAKHSITLTKEELTSKEYSNKCNKLLFAFLESLVGKEALIHFLINLLKKASDIQYEENSIEQQQMDRMESLRKESIKEFKKALGGAQK